MLARQRQEYILELLDRQGGIRVAEVVEALEVSEMTVRRDITELVNQGLAQRVHGGAVPALTPSHEPNFDTKSTQHQDAKARIGQAAAELIRPHDSLALSAGTTTLAIAQALPQLEHFATLTIVTNSLPAAQSLFDAADEARAKGHPAPTVLLTGGERTPSNALVGPSAVDTLESLQVKWVFLGAHGFSPEIGLMTPNLNESAVNHALIKSARTIVAAVDSSKWNVMGIRTFCPTSELSMLVTDAPPAPEISKVLKHHDISVIVAQ